MNARQGGRTKALQAYIVVDDSQERDCRCYARESIVLELLSGLAHEAKAHVHDRPPSYLTNPHPCQHTKRDSDRERDEWDDEQQVVAILIPAPAESNRPCAGGSKVLMRTYFQISPAERRHEGDTKSTSKLMMLQMPTMVLYMPLWPRNSES